ncbi:MAG: hypothetical protein ACUVQP_02545 [Bacteroidales bacterium]
MNQNNLHKKQPFSVPEGYFDSFPDKVLNKINELSVQQYKTSKHLLNRRQLSIAAVFIGFFLVSYTFFSIFMQNNKNNNIAQNLTYEDAVLQYVNEKDLIETIDYAEKPISSEQLEEYLINENIHESVVTDNLNQ